MIFDVLQSSSPVLSSVSSSIPSVWAGFDLLSSVATTVPAAVGGNYIWVAYAAFVGMVIIFLALDLGVFHREAHVVSMKEAINWSVVWVTLGLLFGVFVYFAYENKWLGLGESTRMFNKNTQAVADGTEKAIVYGVMGGYTAAVQYVTGYVVEKSLAMDNIFVIAMLFGFFAIPRKYQHRVLFWGIIGAIVMRGAMIGLGSELVMRYQWILIIFGVFLILTALKMWLIKSETDPSKNKVVKLAKKVFPVTNSFHGQKFFVRLPADQTSDSHKGQVIVMAMTPLFLALIMVEITDLVFAVDSIPAIFAITPDPFIVFTSNIFAVLGLRALYFCLAALIAKFRFLKPALILILVFVGIKLLLLSVPPYLDVIGLDKSKPIKIEPFVSLAVILSTLTIATVLSILLPAKDDGQPGDGHSGAGH